MTTFFSHWICKRLVNNRMKGDMSALVWDAMCMGHAGGRHSLFVTLREGEGFQKSSLPHLWSPSFSPLLGTVPKKVPGQSASYPLAQEPWILIHFIAVPGHCPQLFCKPTLHLLLVSCSLHLYLSLSPPPFVFLPPSLLHPQIQNFILGGYWWCPY